MSNINQKIACNAFNRKNYMTDEHWPELTIERMNHQDIQNVKILWKLKIQFKIEKSYFF